MATSGKTSSLGAEALAVAVLTEGRVAVVAFAGGELVCGMRTTYGRDVVVEQGGPDCFNRCCCCCVVVFVVFVVVVMVFEPQRRQFS